MLFRYGEGENTRTCVYETNHIKIKGKDTLVLNAFMGLFLADRFLDRVVVVEMMLSPPQIIFWPRRGILAHTTPLLKVVMLSNSRQQF